MGYTREVCQYHAEAVIKRHGNTEAILMRKAHHLAHKIAVIKNVVMGEACALRKSGSTRCVLYIDNIVEIALIDPHTEFFVGYALSQ